MNDGEKIAVSARNRGGRPRQHGFRRTRDMVRQLGTAGLDGRTTLARAVAAWKQEVRADLGGNLSRAQETLLELAAQSWVIVCSLDAWIAEQPGLVTRKRTVLPVIVERQRMADSLARQLERLGLERRAKPVPDLTTYLAGRSTPTQNK